MSSPVSFGQWIKQRRKVLDLTQTALAQLAQCSVSAIEKIEADRRRPARSLAERLADLLDISAEDRPIFLRAARAVDHAVVAAPPSNLAQPQTTFIGRAQERVAVQALLRQPEVRLLTLTGTGGIGKTRLALQIAADLVPDFPHGVTFVPLAAVRDPQLVTATIARALPVPESGPRSHLELLQAALCDQQRLLVLDNVEHLLPAAAQIADLLAALPNLKLLITSRAPLRIPDEHEVVVPPLGQPLHLKRLPSVPVLAQDPAIALFLARSQAVQPHFVLTRANAAAVAEICARLEGIPLAIELAAARTRLFEPSILLSRLGSRLGLLTGGRRDLPPRHQTLRATLDWSFNLLKPDEQILFARLAVLVGGGTLKAIEAICATVGDQTIEVLNGVTTLLEQHLLQQDGGMEGEPRFNMLETLREYAWERLVEQGQQQTLLLQYASYYQTLAEPAFEGLVGPDQLIWLKKLKGEHENLRAAIRWALEQDQGVLALRLCYSIWRFWWIEGYLHEGRRWLQQALAASQTAPAALRANALNGAGVLALQQGDFAQAQHLCEESLALRRQLDDKVAIGNALNNLGVIARAQGDYARAIALYEEALARQQALGDVDLASRLYNSLGGLLWAQGEYQRAQPMYEAALRLDRVQNDSRGTATSLSNLGAVLTAQGQLQPAQAMLVESLDLWLTLNDHDGIAECLITLADLSVAQGQPIRAARLLGAAEALREEISGGSMVAEQAYLARIVAAVHSHLDAAAFGAAWATGRTMPLTEVIADALGPGAA